MVFSQTLNFTVYDSTTREILRDAKIVIIDNSGKYQMELKTNKDGWAQVTLPDSSGIGTEVAIIVSKPKYLSADLSYSPTFKKKDTVNYSVTLKDGGIRCSFGSYIAYENGQVQPSEATKFLLAEFITTCKENPTLKIEVIITYASEVENGYNLSVSRVSYIKRQLAIGGLDPDEFIFTIRKGKQSRMDAEVVRVKDEK